MSISAVWLSPHNRARVRGPGPRPRALRDHTGMRVQVLRSQPRADSTVGDEAKDNPLRFTTDIVRFTRPVCNGVAGMAPDPQSRAGEWAGLVDSWAQSNQDWVKGRQVAWDTDPQHLSYTMLLGSALTGCYALALAKSPPLVRSRSGQAGASLARPLYERNVGKAFKDLGINPSKPSLGAPTLGGVGWLRYRFF